MVWSVPKSPYTRALVLCLLVVSVRAYLRVAYAGLWAEDGLIYLYDYLDSGLRSVFIPFAGYYVVLQRLCYVFVVNVFPVDWWPYVVTVCSTGFYAFLCAQFSRPSYEWLVPSATHRTIISLLLCIAPGTNEVVGNLANLHWLLVVWIALIGLRDPKIEITWPEILLCFLVIVSTGTFFTLIPLYICRWVWMRRLQAPSSLRLKNALMLGVLILGLGLMGVSYLTGDRGAGRFVIGQKVAISGSDFVTKGPLSYSNYVVRSGINRPWIGGKAANYVNLRIPNSAKFGWGAFFFLGLVAVFWLRRYRSFPERVLFFYLFGMSIWVFPAWFARPDSITQLIENQNFGDRYAFPLGFSATIFWSFVALRSKGIGRVPWLFAIFVGLTLFWARETFWIQPYDPVEQSLTRPWHKYSGPLWSSYTTGCPKKVVYPIHPNVWVPFESKLECPTKP
jgi:hypothetical protein